jgi:sulfane dehydrogenase subunit SoxC
LRGPVLYEISGLAWSGYGKVNRVDVSADGGKSWGEAHLQEPVLPKALTRFRMAWQWNGAPSVLQSRATDETGYVQPTRDQLIALRGDRGNFHNNMIQSWGISTGGEAKNVYA